MAVDNQSDKPKLADLLSKRSKPARQCVEAVTLTDKQQGFVAEYLIDGNATQAAIRAGYSQKTADRIGPELLGKTCVAGAIAEARRQVAERIGADVVEKCQRLTQEALDWLIAIGRDEDAPAAARVSAAREILDHGWGKAPQTVEMRDASVPARLSRAELLEIAAQGRHIRSTATEPEDCGRPS